jgi:hypothetical protein
MTTNSEDTSNNDAALDAFLDAGAEVLAQLRQDWAREKTLIAAEQRALTADFDALLAPIRERLAMLEGKVSVLLGEPGASSVRSKRAKQAPVNGNRLLEHQRPQQ